MVENVQKIKIKSENIWIDLIRSIYAPYTTLATVEPKSRMVVPTWSLPPPEAGPSRLPPPQPEAGPSRIPSSRKETRAATPPEEVNLRSYITMEVDDEYEWMKEASYKLVDGPLPLSKR